MRLIILTCVAVVCLNAAAQENLPFAGIASPPGFRLKDDVVAVYDSFSHVYRINFSDGEMIYRRTYDTAFSLIDEYSFSSSGLSLSGSPSEGKLGAALPIITGAGYFEVYASDRLLEIYKLDYASKRDTLVAQFGFDHRESSGESITSLIPNSMGLKILTYSKKRNEFKIYSWNTIGDTAQSVFPLPEKSLTKDEEKIYDEVTVIKLRTLWKEKFAPVRVNTVKTFPGENQLYYTNDHIYIILPIPYGMGIYLIDLDTRNNLLETRNYYINDLRVNVGDDHAVRMKAVGMVLDTNLVILNSSRRRFEYHLYSLNGLVPIRKLSVPVADSFFHLVHSPLVRKGSQVSREDEKEFKKEKHFMKVTGGDFSFMNISGLDQDSAMITFVHLKKITTLEGRVLRMVLHYILPPFPYGNFNYVPYMTSYKYNLLYGHSKFHRKSFTPSTAKNLQAAIDPIVNSFAASELQSSSSFFVERNGDCFIGIKDPEKPQYNIYRFSTRN